MKFEEVLPALLDGKKIRRKSWTNGNRIIIKNNEITDSFNRRLAISVEGFKADDWEIVKEKKKVKFRDLTKEQFKKYCESITKAPGKGHICSTCPFHNVSCTDWHEEGWIYHKDLYSDKFLDQEIEINDDDDGLKVTEIL